MWTDDAFVHLGRERRAAMTDGRVGAGGDVGGRTYVRIGRMP